MSEQAKSLEEILKELNSRKQEVKVSIQDLTEMKISQAEERIKQIEQKIEKLNKEKEDLLRKNANRRKSLQDRMK